MGVFKKESIASLISALLMCSMTLPTLSTWSHAFGDHLEQKCTDKITLHLHKAEADCAFLKIKPAPHFFYVFCPPECFVPIMPRRAALTKYNYIATFQKLEFQLRAPPATALS